MSGTKIQSITTNARPTLAWPEKLWWQYCIALVITLGLFIGTYAINHIIVNRGLQALSGIKDSNEQVLLAQDIVSSSDRLVAGTASQFLRFDKTVARLEVANGDILSNQIRSESLSDHYFGGSNPLYARLRTFLNTAKQYSAANDPTQRENLNRRLHQQFEMLGIRVDLLQSARLVTEQLQEEAAFYKGVQRLMLIAAALVLLAEARLIFLPAHRAVVGSIQSLKSKGEALSESQRNLKQVNSKLEHAVRHDQLTGLPNRNYLTEYLAKAIADNHADAWNVYLVGLDDFKSINDMMGHDYGDALLVSVGHSLQSCIDEEHMAARVSGDEFALISSEPSPFMTKRIMAAFRDPFLVKGRRVPISASIGYLEIDSREKRPLDILADAEIALRCAKNVGGGQALAFTRDLRSELGMMQQLQLDLSDAIRDGQIEPWFQPQVRLSDGRLHGAEVLARWRHPTRGLLAPDSFLPAAERAGLMVDLDHAIWRTAMDQAKEWERSEVWHPVISLNAAPDTIADPYLLERFLLLLQRSGLAADQVVVEVLETTLIDGKDDMAAINIDSLADCGIALELDDFGTGYASLSKLTQLPLSGLKLDRSLVSPLPDPAADSIVRAILALAAELGLTVIAEGIEESQQAAHLNDRGCAIGQGYGFGKPMPAQEFTAWLATHANARLDAGPDLARFARGT